MLIESLGAAAPLVLVPYAYYLTRKETRYVASRLPPRRMYLLTVMLMQWVGFLVTWLVGLLAAYAAFLFAMLLVLNREPELHAVVLRGVMFPFDPEHILWHVAIVVLPLFLLVSLAWRRKAVTRQEAQRGLRLLLDGMIVAFVVAYFLCAWTAVSAVSAVSVDIIGPPS